MFECVKTGAHIQIGGRYAYGDLFRVESVWILNVADWVDRKPHQFWGPLHAHFETWHHWFGETSKEGKSVIILPAPTWFVYAGKTVE